MSFDSADLAQHVDPLYRYTLSVTRDPELAADMVQDTLLRALDRQEQYRNDAPLGHWLMRIAHNMIIDRARRADHEVLVDVIEEAWQDDAYTVDVESVLERAATRDELLDALVRLPYIYRSAVVLHDIEEHRVIDIAAIHDITLPAAKQRLRRGRMALVTALADGHHRRAASQGVPMPCWDARRHVSEYMNGDLDSSTASAIEAHLSGCPTCPPLYAALVGVHSELGCLRDPDSVIQPALEQKIRAAIDS